MTGYPREKMSVELETPFSVDLPEGKISFVVKEDCSGDFLRNVDRTTLGRTPLTLKIYCDGKLYKTFRPIFDLDVKVPAVITTRWIKRGEMFVPAQVTRVEVNATELPPRAVTQLRELEGKVARYQLQAV